MSDKPLKYTPDLSNVSLNINYGSDKLNVILTKVYNMQLLSIKDTKNGSEAPFESVNKYLESVPASDKERMFSSLKDIDNFITNYFDQNSLIPTVKKQLENMMTIKSLQYPAILKWVEANIVVPKGFDKSYNSASHKTTSEQTYLYNDYLDIVVLAIQMKMLAPIMGLFMKEVRDTVGLGNKELETLKIIPEIIKSTPGYKKLRTYTKVTVGKTSISPADILRADTNSENRPDWMLGHLLVKRIVAGAALDCDTDRNIITYIFNHIWYKTVGHKSNNIIPKPFSGTDDGNDSLGVYETYKVKTMLPVASQVALTGTSEDWYTIPRVRDHIKVSEFNKLAAHIAKFPVYIDSVHTVLSQWVFQNIIPPSSFRLYNREAIKRLLSIAFLLMRERHPQLALFMVSTPVYNEETGELAVPLPVRRSRLSEDDTNRITKLYPCYGSDKLKSNVVISSIENVSRDITSREWMVLAPQEFLTDEQKGSISEEGFIIIPPISKKLLLELIIDLDNIIAGNNIASMVTSDVQGTILSDAVEV